MLQTERLRIRHFGPQDAAFILELLNDPDWIRFIGNRNLRTPDDARAYIEKSLASLYKRLGFGLDLVELRDTGEPIGMCGLIKRDTLEHVDLGFAYLPAFRGKGYGYEAGVAALDYGVHELGLERIVAITSPDNDASGKLLRRLGFEFQGAIAYGNESELSNYFTYDP
jgi:RimJ/RimL family protein N-acetyltransferase